MVEFSGQLALQVANAFATRGLNGMPGFVVGNKEDKMGIRGSDTHSLMFTDVKVPKAIIWWFIISVPNAFLVLEYSLANS